MSVSDEPKQADKNGEQQVSRRGLLDGVIAVCGSKAPSS